MRLFMTWLVLTALGMLFAYGTDKLFKREARHWFLRMLFIGVPIAVILSLIIFFERM